ncbi:MAG: malonate transporter subunit MadM [Endozoicomonas sp.]
MTIMTEALLTVLLQYSLVTAFAVTGLILYFSNVLSDKLTAGRLHGSAIAIMLGLALSALAGSLTGGSRGLADFPALAGIGLMGSAMLRDLTIVATAFGVHIDELKQAGLVGTFSLLAGLFAPFVVGAGVAYAFGYQDPVSMTTLGAGAATYIVGPVTGSALGASSEVITLSVAAGLIKSMLVMIMTPLMARPIGLDNPRAAMIFGGLMGTTSGVTAGLAATDSRLVPYGAMTATFYTGLGCFLGPSVMYTLIRAAVL